jgi:hypothetical protein
MICHVNIASDRQYLSLIMSVLGIYRHYKGSLYHLMALARHTETGEIMAVYNGLENERRTWVRPLNMFESDVLHEDKLVKRFTKIDNNPFVSPPDYQPDPLEPPATPF